MAYAVPDETGMAESTAEGAGTPQIRTLWALTVAVAGHPLQPHVIDSDLLYAVSPGDCMWAFEGKGSKRELVLSLEKTQPDLEWASLLDDVEGRKKKGLTELAAGIEETAEEESTEITDQMKAEEEK